MANRGTVPPRRSGAVPSTGGSLSAKTAVPPPLPRGLASRFFGCLGLILIGFAVGFVLLLVVGLVGLFSFGVGPELTSYLTKDLPPIGQVFTQSTFQSTMIYDRNGQLLYEIFDPQGGRRTVVALKRIPPALIDATLGTEDPNFYTEPGFDPLAIVRAAIQDVAGGHGLSGASTITQQLVRRVLMSPQEQRARTIQRKLIEIILAYRVTQSYSKDEILQRYLNEIYYGNLAYGAEAASETYFNKPVQQLTLPEAALIAGLPQAPSLFDPFIHPQAAKQRQIQVLQLMVKHGYLTPEQATQAASQPLRFHSAQTSLEAPHFVMYIRSLLEQRYGRKKLYTGGLKVYTSLDLTMQHQAEQVVRDRLPQLKNQNAQNAAVVALDPKTGEILAMVGSADFWNDSIQGQINMALAERQAGSTFKPFLYLYAFDHHESSPATLIADAPVQYPMGPGQSPYRPIDADGKFRGAVTIRRALANSLNVPAVEMLNAVGIRAFVDELHAFGIGTIINPNSYGLSLALGSAPVRLLDLTYAYAGMANDGTQVGEPVPASQQTTSSRVVQSVAILKVTDSSGKVLDQYQPGKGVSVASPQATWLVNNILSDNAARTETFGADSYLQLNRPAAVKTGTTSGFKDSWTIGYTPQLAVGVWVGNANDQPMKNLDGAHGAGLIWHAVMTQLLAQKPVEKFIEPPGLTRASVDAQTGLLPVPGRPTITDWFVSGTLPSKSAPLPTATVTGTATPTAVPSATQTPLPTVTPSPSPTKVPTPQVTQTPRATVNPNFVVVPHLVGLPVAEAQRLIVQANLRQTYVNYQTINEVQDKSFFLTVHPGDVVSQQPEPGAPVPKGTTVFLAVRKN